MAWAGGRTDGASVRGILLLLLLLLLLSLLPLGRSSIIISMPSDSFKFGGRKKTC
ncbi:MAG: hypothetical protein K6253_01200 [Candidatus Liberibacter asiaticus]|nr:hypothetical protein [Candidatus Liberibacter asiaticus]